MVGQSTHERLKQGLNLVVVLAAAWLLMGCSIGPFTDRVAITTIGLGETETLQLNEYSKHRLTLLEVSPDLKAARIRVEIISPRPRLPKEYWIDLGEPIPFTGYAELSEIKPHQVTVVRRWLSD